MTFCLNALMAQNMLLIMFGLVLCCLLLNAQQFAHSAQLFDVLKYGVKAGGEHTNTGEIAKAISAASDAGGGIVHFPQGHYLTGPIQLKSNVTLLLDDGAVIKFSDNFDDYYPLVKVRDGGLDIIGFSPLIYADHVSNIAILGHGNATLDGSGEKWWSFYNHLRAEHKKTGHWNSNGTKWQRDFQIANSELFKSYPEEQSHNFIRPSFFLPIHSDHITVQGVTFMNSPNWHLHPTYSDYIKIDHVKVIAPGSSPNTDGIDADSCRFMTISNCVISVGDDCICIKSGKDKQARMINRPSENITVTDCVMHTGTGFSIGSEMSGSIRNVVVRNLTFNSSDRGILIKTARGRGGVVENVQIADIVMHNISHEAIAIHGHFFNLNPKEEPISERTPTFRDIHIENVSGEAKLGIQIDGLAERPFERIELTNVHITAKQVMLIKDAHVSQTNVTYHVNKHLFDHISFN